MPLPPIDETRCVDTHAPKAEPFKQWLARVGYERIEETEDPELALDRAMGTYLKKGYSRDWINQRLKSIEVRKELTDEITKASLPRHAVTASRRRSSPLPAKRWIATPLRGSR